MTLVLSIVSGLLMAMAMPAQWGTWVPPNLGALMLVAFVPLLIAIKGIQSERRVFWHVLLSNIIFQAITLYWIFIALHTYGHLPVWVSVVVLFLLIVMFAVYFSLVVTMAHWTAKKLRLPLWITVAIFWTAAEWGRFYIPFNGFPWGHVAMAWSFIPEWIQSAQWGGVSGIVAFIMILNGLAAECWSALSGRRYRLVAGLAIGMAVLFQANVTLGNFAIRQVRSAMGTWPSMRVSMVQANISQDQKWNESLARDHLLKHRQLSEPAYASSDLIIWPEASYPFTVKRDQLSISLYGDSVKGRPDHLIGAITENREEEDYYNSALLVDGEYGNVVGRYDKSHLVPFGEYVPLRKWLTFIGKISDVVGEFHPGEWIMPMVSLKGVIGPLICYEDIFPEIARVMTYRGAHLLVNMTNDAWYGWSSAARQHLGLSVFRAIENRRFLIRATNSGVSATVDPTGSIVMAAPMFEASLMQATVGLNEGLTVFTQYGDFVGKYMAMIAGLLLAGSWLARRSGRYAQ